MPAGVLPVTLGSAGQAGEEVPPEKTRPWEAPKLARFCEGDALEVPPPRPVVGRAGTAASVLMAAKVLTSLVAAELRASYQVAPTRPVSGSTRMVAKYWLVVVVSSFIWTRGDQTRLVPASAWVS